MTDLAHASTSSEPTLAELTVPPPEPGPADWNDDGIVILDGLIPDGLIDAYEAEWWEANGPGHRALSRPTSTANFQHHAGLWKIHAKRNGGWDDCTPYMRHPALRELLCYQPLADVLEELLGEPGGLHLNLTGWVSTERDWHQDSYLNEPEVGDFYAAVWVALGDIHPASGPFQYVPGSHRWPQVTRDLIAPHVDLEDPAWPKHSEDILSPLFTEEIAARGATVVTHLPERGDVLVWHGRLLHRGSKPEVPGAYRPAVIAHYSGIHHRPAMGTAVQTVEGGWIFPLNMNHPVR